MWHVLPLKTVATEQRKSVNPATLGDQLVDHYSIPALDSAGKPEVVPAREIQSSKQSLKGGEVIVSRLNPRKARVHNVPDLHERIALASGEFIVMRPRHIKTRFLKYCLLAESTRQYLDSRVQSVTRSHQRIRPEILMKLPISAPDLPQQQAIADYLDSETARIDALISKKPQLIRLLEERKTLLAEEAIGILRESEPLVPLKYLVCESDRRYGSGPEPTMLSVSIHRGVTPRDAFFDKESRADNLSSYKKCELGDIVINRMRAFQGGVGVVGHMGVVSPDYTVLQVGSRVSPDYLHYVMRSSWFVSEMTRRLRGIGATDQVQVRTPRINFADLGLIRVPVPPREKQDELFFDLANQEAHLTQAVDLQTRQIGLLAERRQALITAIVTGEMSVPSAAA